MTTKYTGTIFIAHWTQQRQRKYL